MPSDRVIGAAGVVCSLSPTPLGILLVAETKQGVLAISLGDDEAALLTDLQASLPPSCPVQRQPPGQPTPWAATIQAQLSSESSDVEGEGGVPLVLMGTPFQVRVWAALQQIPRGETRTYAALATAVGLGPGGARAVAQGCARNRHAVLVPCHRVVPAGGGVGGYRWGAARKAALLAGERASDG